MKMLWGCIKNKMNWGRGRQGKRLADSLLVNSKIFLKARSDSSDARGFKPTDFSWQKMG